MNTPLRSATYAVLVTLGLGWLWWAATPLAADPPASGPITLGFHDTPMYLGPHEHWLTALAFSPDGKTLATAAADGCLRLWDATDGRLRSIHSEDGARGIHALAYSPDARMIATAGSFFGNDLVLWDTAKGSVAREFVDPLNPTDPSKAQFIYKGKPFNLKTHTALAYSPDGRFVATAPDGVYLYDVADGKVAARLNQSGKNVKSVAFSPDGKTLAAAGEDRRVRLWTLPSDQPQATLKGPSMSIVALAFSPDGKHLAAITEGLPRPGNPHDLLAGSQCWVWDRSTGEGHKVDLGKRAASSLAFVSAATFVVGAGKDVLVCGVAASEQPTAPRVLASQSEVVTAVAVSPDGRHVASGSRDRTVDVVDLSSGDLVYRLPGLGEIITCVAIRSDGRMFATASGDVHFSNRVTMEDPSFDARTREYFSGANNESRCVPSAVRLWSAEDGTMKASFPLKPMQVTSIAFVPGSELMAIAGWVAQQGGVLAIWDTARGELSRELIRQGGEVLSVAASADGRTLASGDADGNLQLWDRQKGARTLKLHHDFRVEAVAFNADGRLVAVAGDHQAMVYESASGKRVHELKSRARLKSVAFSPDSTLLAAGTRVPGLELWNLPAGTESRTLTATGDHFETMPGYVAFSPDGKYLVCGGQGKDIAVFDVATGTLNKQLRGHYHASTAAAFLPNGRLVSGAEERTTRLWDVDRGHLLATWVYVPADPMQHWDEEWVGYTPQGQFVSSPSEKRLVGWQTGGDTLTGTEHANRRMRVHSLFSPAR